jgi:hypothetical protein
VNGRKKAQKAQKRFDSKINQVGQTLDCCFPDILALRLLRLFAANNLRIFS